MLNLKKVVPTALILTALLTSCNQSSNEVYSRPMEEYASGNLRVAYTSYSDPTAGYGFWISELTSTYRNLNIIAEPYETKDEFLTAVTTQLNAGEGPDLFLLDQGTPLSMQKMIRSGVFADLTPYIEADSRMDLDSYAGFSAGEMDGKQYILPFSVSSFALYTTEEKLDAYGVTLSETPTYDEILAALEIAADKGLEDSSLTPVVPLLSRTDLSYFWLDAFNVPVVDLETGKVVLDKEFYRRLADLSRKLYPHFMDIFFEEKYSIYQSSEGLKSTIFVLDNRDRFISNYCSAYTLFNEIGETPVRIPMPTYEDSNVGAGQIYTYAAINSDSDKILLAYETARAIMDYPLEFRDLNTKIPFNGAAPANQSLYQSFLGKLVSYQTNTMIDGERVPIIYPTDVIRQLTEEPVEYTLGETSIEDIVRSTMQEYVSGETDDFDGCWDNMVNRLELYLDE